MPELPDLTVYLEALECRLGGQELQRVRLQSPFLLRSFDPSLSSAEGRRVTSFRRLGKRLVLGLEGELFLVIHLMVAGRLSWRRPGAKPSRRQDLVAFDFDAGSLVLTEASSKKRASLYVVAGEEALREHDPGGLEVLTTNLEGFREALIHRNHTLKRALTDPRGLAGIGNAYSDEILHRAGLSPFKQTQYLKDEEWEQLFHATVTTLKEWTERLRAEVGEGFPKKVTAFRPEMAVHGRFGQPCPVCTTPVQRIVYAENEANYCPTCQTGGRLLADRALSQLLKKDWPRSLEALEALKRQHKRPD